MKSIESFVFEDKTKDLYDHLRYYGHENIAKAAYKMLLCPDDILINHWQTLRELYNYWDSFRCIAQKTTREEFTRYVRTGELPKDHNLDLVQKLLWQDNKQRILQSRFVLDFLLSLNSYFEKDILLLEKGYIEPDPLELAA